MTTTIQQILIAATKLLHKHSSTPRLDAEVLLAHTLNITPTTLLTKLHDTVKSITQKLFQELIELRLQRQPIAYICGTKEFFGIPLVVSKDVLIPRPETEHLVEHALHFLQQFNNRSPLHICDVGTGSGCILTAIAHHFQKPAHYTGIDFSNKALQMAQRNFAQTTTKKAEFLQSDLFNSIPKNTQYDCIIANLPYLSDKEYQSTQTPEIFHEPKHALVASWEGLSLNFELLTQLQDKLTEHGKAFCEFSPWQLQHIKKFITTKQLPFILKPFCDYENTTRFCSIQKI